LHGGSSASKVVSLPFWGTLLSQKPKIGRIGQRVKDDECSSWRLRSVTSAQVRRIGMCGYTAVPEDSRTCFLFRNKNAFYVFKFLNVLFFATFIYNQNHYTS